MATFVCVKEKWLRKGYIYLVWIYLIRLGAWKGSNCSKRFTQSKQHALLNVFYNRYFVGMFKSHLHLIRGS